MTYWSATTRHRFGFLAAAANKRLLSHRLPGVDATWLEANAALQFIARRPRATTGTITEGTRRTTSTPTDERTRSLPRTSLDHSQVSRITKGQQAVSPGLPYFGEGWIAAVTSSV